MIGKSVAILGASSDRAKYGNKSVRAHLRQGWAVYPVNPRDGEIEGRKAYRSIADIPVRIDRVSLYLPPEMGLRVLADIAAAHPAEFFVNPGAESDELVARARALGLEPLLACSILDLGEEPTDFSD